MLNHRNSNAKQTKKSVSSFNSNRMSCSLLAPGSGTEAAKRERRRQGGSRGPGMAHPADLFYLEARGLGACHPHLLAGQKEHLQEGVGGEGPSCPKRCWRWAPGWARAGRRRHEGPHTHTQAATGPPQRASRARSAELVFSPPTQNHRTPKPHPSGKTRKPN